PFEFQGAAKDYRHERSFDAIGSNCVALAQGNKEHPLLYTETVPLYEQPWYRTRNDLPVDFSELDDNPNNQPLDKLTKLHLRMGEYLDEWSEYLRDQASGDLTQDQMSACSLDRQNFA